MVEDSRDMEADERDAEAERDAERDREVREGPPTDARVLFVGIGGTGKEIVSIVKAGLLARRGKRNGDESKEDKLGFLVIDVDPSPPRVPNLRNVLAPNEICLPAERHLPSVVQGQIVEHIAKRGNMAWVGERVPPGEMTLEYNNFVKGTERYRQAGLLAFLWEEQGQGVSSALRAAIERVTQGARESISLQIFIICSICGGTGSGMLIDTAYLARDIGQAHSANSCDVSAVLVMPGVFRRIVDDATYGDLQRNASAVLTELDYFMYSADRRESRTCNPNDVAWPLRSAARQGHQLDTKVAIFQSVFLIDNQRNNGGMLGGAEVVFPAVADLLRHLSGAVIGDRFLAALNNAKSTLKRRLQTGGLGGDMPHYSSLGLARVVLPIRRMSIEAAPVLSKDVLARLRGESAEIPSEADISSLIRSLGLEPGTLPQTLGLARGELTSGLAKAIDLANPKQQHRIAVVSDRVTAHVRQKGPPDPLRRSCLDAIEKAKRYLAATQDEAHTRTARRLTRLAQEVEKVLNDELDRARKMARGLEWFPKLVGEVAKKVDKQRVEAGQTSARDRAEALARTEEEFRRTEDRLASCAPGAVRQVAAQAARKCDDWINQKLDLVLAQTQVHILDDCLARLKRAVDAALSLDTFLTGTLPAEMDKAVASLRRKCQMERPVTDMQIAVDGKKLFELEKSESARMNMVTECLEDISVVGKGGDLHVTCGGQGHKPVVLGASARPSDTAREWVECLAARLVPHFQSHSLDDFILDDDTAVRYASACLKEAEAFIRYDPTVQKSEAGEPITITLAVAPADSRLYGAFSKADQVRKALFPSDDQSVAIVFKGEIGILGKVLQFRKDAVPLDASMVDMPGLWILGQVSHNTFWHDPVRWWNLRLFFLSLAAGRIRRDQTQVGALLGTGPQSEYSLVISHGQTRELGLGLQKAILEFLSPNLVDHRTELQRDLVGPAVWSSVEAALPDVQREFGKLIQKPDEVPAAALRTVLGFLLKSLGGEASPKGAKKDKTETVAG